MRISKQPSPVQIMTDQKQQNEEYFKYLGSIVTNDARRISKIKSRTAKPKAVFN